MMKVLVVEGEQTIIAQLQEILHSIDSPIKIVAAAHLPGRYKTRFLVKQGQRFMSIPVEEIAYFFSEERFIFFKTFDNQKFLVEYRMDELEQILDPARFSRVNRSYLISIHAVQQIHPYFSNRLKLFVQPAAEKDVIVSRERVTAFKAWLGE